MDNPQEMIFLKSRIHPVKKYLSTEDRDPNNRNKKDL